MLIWGWPMTEFGGVRSLTRDLSLTQSREAPDHVRGGEHIHVC